jgi:hypothetical protein
MLVVRDSLGQAPTHAEMTCVREAQAMAQIQEHSNGGPGP